MKKRISQISIVISVLIIAMLIMSSCTNMVIEEFPLKTTLNSDFITYAESMVDEEVEFYTLTIKDRNYAEDTKQVVYSCSVQYKWNQLNEIFTDDCVLTYKMLNGSWAFVSCESEDLDIRVDKKLDMYNLFYDNIYSLENIIPTVNEQNTRLSNKLTDFTIMLDDVVYKLPCSFNELTSNGWRISEKSYYDALNVIEPNSFGTLEMTKDEDKILVYLINTTNNQIFIGESSIGGVKVRSDNSFVQIGTQININSSKEEILNSFGRPDSSEETEEGTKISYSFDEFSSSSFIFNEEYTELEILNFYEVEEEITPSAFFDTYAFNFALDDDYYSLPCQLNLFTDNGWKITKGADNSSSLYWYESAELTLTKEATDIYEEENIEVFVENMSLSELNILSCSVTKAKFSEEKSSFDIINYKPDEVLSISSDAENDEVLSFFGTPAYKENIDDTESLVYILDKNRYLSVNLGESLDIELNASTEENYSLFDRFKFELEFGDHKYEVPVSAEVLIEDGWAPKYGWDLPIIAGGWCEVALANENGNSITVYLCNLKEQESTLKSCIVGGVNLEKSDMLISLSGGINSEMSKDIVIETYGIPYSQVKDGSNDVLMYKDSINKFLCLSFTDNMIDEIWIVNFMFEVPEKEIDKETP